MAGKKTIRKLRTAQKGNCLLCLKPMDLGAETIDHVIPRALGGRNNHDNLALMHSYCNHTKGAEMPSKKLASRYIKLLNVLGWTIPKNIKLIAEGI